MVKPNTYIKNVNKAVRRNKHNRPIKVVYQKSTPSHRGHIGLAMTYHWKTHDEVRMPRNLPKNRAQARKLERTEKGKHIKRTFGIKRIPTKREVLRHELWHVAKPQAKESTIQRYDNKPLPNRLPDRRIKRFDKTR